jgi:hypothetical protein
METQRQQRPDGAVAHQVCQRQGLLPAPPLQRLQSTPEVSVQHVVAGPTGGLAGPHPIHVSVTVERLCIVDCKRISNSGRASCFCSRPHQRPVFASRERKMLSIQMRFWSKVGLQLSRATWPLGCLGGEIFRTLVSTFGYLAGRVHARRIIRVTAKEPERLAGPAVECCSGVERAADAVEHLQTGNSMGKVILQLVEQLPQDFPQSRL